MFKRKNLIILGVFLSFALLIFSIMSSSNISITRAADNSEISFGAEFPNGECKKVFKRSFPFFEFKCSQYSEQTTTDEQNEQEDISNTLNPKEKDISESQE